MNKVFVAAMLSVVLLLTVCVEEASPCVVELWPTSCYDGKHNPYNGLQPTDLAKEYLESRLRDQKRLNHKEELSKLLTYDYSSIWLTENKPRSSDKYTTKDSPQSGVIGLNYQRIDIYIGKVTKSNYNADTYIITGKSKVNKNICNFSGEIRLIKLFYKDCNEDFEEYETAEPPKRAKSTKCAVLFAEYVFYEDSAQNHTGVFKGIMVCDVYTDKTKMLLNEEALGYPHGYLNRTFVGTWTDYKIQKPKHCIWSDGFPPYSGYMRYGDGDYVFCPEYLKYGWQTCDDDKWWLKK